MPIEHVLEFQLQHRAEKQPRSTLGEMIARTPHDAATDALVRALDPFPPSVIDAAARLPTRIWLLDDDEDISSAAILTARMRRRRWYQHLASIDDYLGLTDVGPGYIAMVARWSLRSVIRHEFGHVVTAVLSPSERRKIADLFLGARLRRRFVEPLAARSVGEYVACGITAYVSPDRSEILREIDGPLVRFFDRLFDL